ncbi:MAG: hypothetical protein V1882_04470 [Candidatus Omnitrophota bacterium]
MKTKKIPTVFVLGLYAWAIAALGVLVGAYWIFFKANGHESLVSGFLIMVGSSLCAVVIRVFGNLAQMMFDQGQKMEEVNQKLVQLDRLAEIKQKLVALDRLEEIKQRLVALDRLEEIKQKLVALDRLEEIKQKLVPLDRLEEIKQKLVPLDQLGEIRQRLVLLDQLEEIKLKLVPPDQFESIYQASEQISCDSKDISQGIHQIKEFFERIQNHLDLNK